MSAIGADPEALGRLADSLHDSARRVDTICHGIQTLVATSWWRGTPARRFRAEWTARLRPSLGAVARSMDSAAASLRVQGAQQSAAGDVPPGGGANAVGRGQDRRFLLVDHEGDGRAIEVFGDLTSAQRVGVWVPGVGTDLGDLEVPDRLGARRIWDGSEDLAMVEWLDYDPPDTVLAAGLERGSVARRSADALNRFVSELKAAGVEHVVLGGHSYGAVVVAHAAAAGTAADELVLAGSPGVPVGAVGDFRLAGGAGSELNVHVLTNDADPIAWASLLDDVTVSAAASALGLGLAPLGAMSLAKVIPVERIGPWLWPSMATDPRSPAFGADILEGRHDGLEGLVRGGNHDYTEPGTNSLVSLRRVFRGTRA